MKFLAFLVAVLIVVGILAAAYAAGKRGKKAALERQREAIQGVVLAASQVTSLGVFDSEHLRVLHTNNLAACLENYRSEVAQITS